MASAISSTFMGRSIAPLSPEYAMERDRSAPPDGSARKCEGGISVGARTSELACTTEDRGLPKELFAETEPKRCILRLIAEAGGFPATHFKSRRYSHAHHGRASD